METIKKINEQIQAKTQELISTKVLKDKEKAQESISFFNKLKSMIRGILSHEKKFDKIDHVIVKSGSQVFTVKDKKKIKFWMDLAKNQIDASIYRETHPTILIKKVVYNGD